MNAAANSAFPFFFPNPSLLYTPLGLGGLNPYSLPGGMAAYDQLAQQCNLLNGAGLTGKIPLYFLLCDNLINLEIFPHFRKSNWQIELQ